jgi:hypothetical protein
MRAGENTGGKIRRDLDRGEVREGPEKSLHASHGTAAPEARGEVFFQEANFRGTGLAFQIGGNQSFGTVTRFHRSFLDAARLTRIHSSVLL